MSLLLISPLYPPLRGGLADHSECLARHFSASDSTFVLTSHVDGVEESRDEAGVRVCRGVHHWGDQDEVIRSIEAIQADGPLIWQYVPHMYGRLGCNLAIPKVWKYFAKKGRRSVMLAHEIAGPFTSNPKSWIPAILHRWQWSQAVKYHSALGISTEAWLDQWRHRYPGAADRFFFCPSPSNIPSEAIDPALVKHWKQGLGIPENAVVLGYFGSHCFQKTWELLMQVWKRIRQQKGEVYFVTFNVDPMIPLTDEEKPLFRKLGYLSASEVAVALSGLSLLLLPYIDGISERRGSFMAGLSLGVTILTTDGPNTGSSLKTAPYFRVVPIDAMERFPEETTRLLDESLGCTPLQIQGYYRKNFDWPVVTQRILQKAHNESQAS